VVQELGKFLQMCTVSVYVCGGGGGGSSYWEDVVDEDTSSGGGGGGGGGAGLIIENMSVSPGDIWSFDVGTGGDGGAPGENAGGDGGDTSFTLFQSVNLSVGGGGGGWSQEGGDGGDGGLDGFNGNAGSEGTYTGLGGAGGDAANIDGYGDGGAGGTVVSAAEEGEPPGGGGGGGSVTYPDGANGADGAIYILYEEAPIVCYNKGTTILCVDKNSKEAYIQIENITPGMLVKTYQHGFRRVDLIGHRQMTNDPTNWKNCMYRLPKSGDMTDDLIVTGAHSILVDKQLTGEELQLQNQYWNGEEYLIDGKYMVLSAVSKQFVKVTDKNEYTYYHIVLEDDGDDNRRYGIWANGILSESQSRSAFLKDGWVFDE